MVGEAALDANNRLTADLRWRGKGRDMTTEVNIPDEAMNRAREAFVRGRNGRSGVAAAVEAAAPLILAADIAEDAGLQVLRDMAERVSVISPASGPVQVLVVGAGNVPRESDVHS